MNEASKVFRCVIHYRRRPTVIFAGARPYVVEDIARFIEYLEYLETPYTGDLPAESADDAVESLTSGAGSNGSLPLAGELAYQFERLEVIGASTRE